MRYMVISDIHGNYAALEAAVMQIQDLHPNGILFLGDYISDGPDPQRVLQTLRKISADYPCHFIRGNREEYFLKNRNSPDPSWQPCSHTGSLWYTAQHLSESDLDWFAQMPISCIIHSDTMPSFMICHGSPVSPYEGLLGSKNSPRREEVMNSIEQNLLLCGHTHRQEIYEIGNKRILFCPSLGLPIRRNGILPAQHMIQLDGINGRWEHTFLTVSYDMEGYIHEMLESPWGSVSGVWSKGIAHTLRTQNNTIVDCLILAKHLAQADSFSEATPIPDAYWEMAAEQLGI